MFGEQTLLSLRGAFRRRARTLMILGLLGLAGGMYMTARSVSDAYQASVDIAAAERGFDAELRLTTPLPRDALTTMIADIPEIASARLHLRMEAAGRIEDGIALVRTYPDGGHGSLSLYAMADTTDLDQFEVLSGMMVADGLSQGLVVNQGALPLLNGAPLDDTVRLSIDGTVLALPLVSVVRQYMTPASAYVSFPKVAAATGQDGANAIRIDSAEPASAIAQLEAKIDASGSGISMVITGNLMDEAVSGHVGILIFLLFALGILMAAVGFLGLTAAQGVSVSERTREFGIIRAIGGQRRQIISNLLLEGLVIAAASLPAALAIGLALSAVIDTIIGRMTFGMALPFTFHPTTLVSWSIVALAGAVIASLPPALNASRLSVRETLIQQ